MTNISVDENIKNITDTLTKIKDIEKEFYRMEGMLRVFTSLRELGIVNIKIPDNEVIDNVPMSAPGGENDPPVQTEKQE